MKNCPPSHKHSLTTNCYYNHKCRCEECVQSVREIWRKRNANTPKAVESRAYWDSVVYDLKFMRDMWVSPADAIKGVNHRPAVVHLMLRRRGEHELADWLKG